MLITGADGFIGRNLMMIAQNDKWGFVSVPLDIKNGFNVNNPDHLNYLYRGGPIIHLAAESGVPQSIDDPDPSFINNTLATFNICKFAKEKKAKLIFASSSAVDDITSPYGASKACAEAYIKAFDKAYDLDYCILRFANVYGPYSDNKTSVVASMIRDAKMQKKINVYVGDQMRDFIYVDDVCNAILKAIDLKGTYQVGTNVFTEIMTLAEKIKDRTLTEIEIHDNFKLAGVVQPNPSAKLLEMTVTSLEEGLNKTFEYYGV